MYAMLAIVVQVILGSAAALAIAPYSVTLGATMEALWTLSVASAGLSTIGLVATAWYLSRRLRAVSGLTIALALRTALQRHPRPGRRREPGFLADPVSLAARSHPACRADGVTAGSSEVRMADVVMDSPPSSAFPERPKVVVREAADINRLIPRLFIHWKLPRVEFHFDSLPPLVVQQAQHHFARISEARIGVPSAMLAVAVFLAGTFSMWASLETLIWTTGQYWQNVGLVAAAALCTGLISTGVELSWMRARLVLLLRRLRGQLRAGAVITEPRSYQGRVSPLPARKTAAATAEVDDLAQGSIQQSLLSRPMRPKLLLRKTADLNRLVMYLFTPLETACRTDQCRWHSHGGRATRTASHSRIFPGTATACSDSGWRPQRCWAARSPCNGDRARSGNGCLRAGVPWRWCRWRRYARH